MGGILNTTIIISISMEDVYPNNSRQWISLAVSYRPVASTSGWRNPNGKSKTDSFIPGGLWVFTSLQDADVFDIFVRGIMFSALVVLSMGGTLLVSMSPANGCNVLKLLLFASVFNWCSALCVCDVTSNRVINMSHQHLSCIFKRHTKGILFI